MTDKLSEDVNSMTKDSKTVEKKTETLQTDSSAVSQTKKEKSHKSPKNEKPTLGETIADYRAEFKKIIWPNREELVKKTITVIFTSVLVGLIIFCMDTVYTTGYNFIIDLLV